jgi:Ca-activated chloride channel homolog
MQHDLLLDYDFAVSRGQYVVRALLRLTGRAPAAGNRTPLNLSLVLDRSGSMSGGKLAAARGAAQALVRRLFPEDVVSVVAYDDSVATVALPGTGAEQTGLQEAIAAIETGGMTNLSGGWLRGRDLVSTRLLPGGVNRVILMTDGQANQGITDPAQLVGLCQEASRRSISTTTIGFGQDFNEHLLRAMADAGSGQTYYIERTDQAGAVFQEELAGLLTLSAQNVAVAIRPVGASGFTCIHHSYPQSGMQDGLRVELGDLYAREPRKLLMEFVAPGGVSGEELEIALVRVVADVLTEAGGVQHQEVTLSVRTSLDPAGRSEPEVRREMLLQDAARAREDALDAERRGDLHAAEQRLRRTAARLQSELPADEVAAGEADDLMLMAERCAAGSVSDQDRKYMHQRAYDVSRSKMSSVASYARVPRSGPITFVRGDATLPQGAGPKLVAHAVDLAGDWGPGFARALSRRWPEVEQRFRAWVASGQDAEGRPLQAGEASFVTVAPDVVVSLLASRVSLRAGRPPQVEYGALEEALGRLREEALRTGSSVHMPRLGTAIGGARWSRVEALVENTLCAYGIPVTVYDL